MKKRLLYFFSMLLSLSSMAQYPYVDINDINFVSASDLSSCNDSSAYLGDTVRTRGIVVMDGSLSEVASSSVSGGSRPFIFVVDTASNGAAGAFKGAEVMGAYTTSSGTFPVTAVENALAGDILEMTVEVGEFDGSGQLVPISNTAVTVVGTTTAPAFATISVGDLNDNNRVNKLTTGEQWEGAFVEIEDVTVTAVNFFSGGNRVSFDVQDQNGNVINVSDRFLAQRTSNHTVVNPNSPNSVSNGGPGTGTFVAPAISTFYNSIKGVVRHSENGCSGGNGRGYELNPFDSLHYNVGGSPPLIDEHARTPTIPTSSETPKVTAVITDVDGSVSKTTLYYSDNLTDPIGSFTSIAMTSVGGMADTYEATLPAFTNNKVIRYYIEAEDNVNQVSTFPITPASATEPEKVYYAVRDAGATIMDVQEPLNPNEDDVSSYDGLEITVTGVVTADQKQHDLGFVHIQDPNGSAWAGVMLDGVNNGLTAVERGEIITVTGIVDEFEQTTIIDVSNTSPSGNNGSVTPVDIDPADSALFASGGMEQYEGMVVHYMNPKGGKVFITNGRLNNFAEYTVSSVEGGSVDISARIQAGRVDQRNRSSLWVSVVSDPVWASDDGTMQVPVVEADTSQTMDTLAGIIYDNFGSYKLLPRNNSDFIGFSEELETSVASYTNASAALVYPNPANDFINIAFDSEKRNTIVELMDISGKTVHSSIANGMKHRVDLNAVEPGIFILRVRESDNSKVDIYKIIVSE